MTLTKIDRPRTAVRVIGGAIIALTLLLTVEISSYIALRFGIIPYNSSLVYTPPTVDPVVFKDYAEFRHPVIGWAVPDWNERTYQVDVESRPNKLFPDTEEACVSTYGDSYTYGSEVTDNEAWANVLSGMLGCKVANYGIGGYGTDQAYLRFKLNEKDVASFKVFGIYPYDLLRNLNQYRPFLDGPGASSMGLKPRFILRDDDLHFIPPMEYSYDELAEGINSPAEYFQHETFIPGSKYGSPVFRFPYSLTMYRFATSDTTISALLKRPSYTSFFKEDHPANAIKISEKITQSFFSLAEKRGSRGVVIVFPTVSSYRYYKRTGMIATQILADVSQRNGIDHIDAHKSISDYLGDREYCEILANPEGCSGHFNAEGSRVIASILKEHIDEKALVE